MVSAALDGDLDGMPTRVDPVFQLTVPVRCPGVPEEILDPRRTWSDAVAYDAQALRLAERFAENFAGYEKEVLPAVRRAGPKTTVSGG
jgi:phosphoenolpyruvate carboxykinase (ATP)